jgi:hypothetical protein
MVEIIVQLRNQKKLAREKGGRVAGIEKEKKRNELLKDNEFTIKNDDGAVDSTATDSNLGKCECIKAIGERNKRGQAALKNNFWQHDRGLSGERARRQERRRRPRDPGRFGL